MINLTITITMHKCMMDIHDIICRFIVKSTVTQYQQTIIEHRLSLHNEKRNVHIVFGSTLSVVI